MATPHVRALIDTLDSIDLMPLRPQDRTAIELAIRAIQGESPPCAHFGCLEGGTHVDPRPSRFAKYYLCDDHFKAWLRATT